MHRLEHNTLTPDVETASDGYARRFAGPVGTYFLARQAAAVARLLSDSDAPGRRALDVGGGHGQLTPLLLQLVVILATARLLGLVLRYFGQSSVIGALAPS